MGATRVDQSDLNEELAFAEHLLDVAAGIALRWFRRPVPVETKDDGSLVTRVDREIECALRDAIAVAYPEDGVLGEEAGYQAGSNGRVWVIDPIDGTRMYVAGIPIWTTLIALRVHGRIELGVADAPAIGDRYRAVRGKGAWRGSERLSVSTTRSVGQAFLMHSGLEGWMLGMRDDALRRLAARVSASSGFADGWAHLLVAQGSTDIVLQQEVCFAWDWAATSLIVEEAGGRVTDLSGCDLRPEELGRTEGLLVTNGRLHRDVLRRLTPARASGPAVGGRRPRPGRERTS